MIRDIIGNIIGTIIVIGVGLCIIHYSFNSYGMRIYGKHSIWGRQHE
jgi:hypothetical protein